MAGDTRSHHQFVVSNDVEVVIRCCIHCGLSHQMERDLQTHKRVWILVLEKEGEEAFAEACPGESGSDDLFPYHHFMVSNHHKQPGIQVVIRFCIRCGLSYLLDSIAINDLGVQIQYPLMRPKVDFIQLLDKNGKGE